MIQCDNCLHKAHEGSCVWVLPDLHGKVWTCSCKGSSEKKLASIDEARSEEQIGRQQERDAFLKWLRAQPNSYALYAADCIERLEHLKETKMKTYTDIEIALAARTAHEVNRAYCVGLGDTSHHPWVDAPEWQRTSAINGVIGVIGGNTPEQSHESWLEDKRAGGWKYGPVKNHETKEHPCFVPYNELPASQKYKDTLYVTTVKGVLGL